MSKSILKLQLPDTQLEAPVLKTFKQADALCFLVGTEHSDHELWLAAKDQPIKLAGTLKEKAFDKAKKVKNGEELALQRSDYDFINTITEPPVLIKATTAGTVKFDLSGFLPALA